MNAPLRRSGMACVLKGSHSFTCTPRVHPLSEWTIPAFAFLAEAGTHLPTPEGWKAELALEYIGLLVCSCLEMTLINLLQREITGGKLYETWSTNIWGSNFCRQGIELSKLKCTRRMLIILIMDLKGLRASVAPLPRDWNRTAGRPRLTWLRTVESDLAPFNIGLATAYHRAQNRQARSKLVRTATSSSVQATWWWWCLKSPREVLELCMLVR